jgi:V/A-type H+-transporting ATPase subunit I
MYGMMFSDLGLGLLLLLAGLWLRHWKLQFAILVAAAGGSGMVFSLLYGAAFGHQIILAAWLKPLVGIWTFCARRFRNGSQR